jgi:hypothetical protein
MKKLAVLSLSVMGILSLSSFTNKNVQEDPEGKHVAQWVVTCADGSYGGSFVCNCNQGQANAIAHIMCSN